MEGNKAPSFYTISLFILLDVANSLYALLHSSYFILLFVMFQIKVSKRINTMPLLLDLWYDRGWSAKELCDHGLKP